MATYNIAPRAESDIDEIWRYIAQDDEEIATRFVRELIDKFILLAENRLIGTRQTRFGPEIRVFPHRKYLVFYFPVSNGVEIFRVLHSARDMESLIEE